MTWRVYGLPYYNDSDLTDTTIYQPMRFSTPVVLKACRIWLVIMGDPTFTSLNMKIYGNDEDAADPIPSVLLETSTNTQSKADLISLDHGVRETYFEFQNPALVKNTWYHFVLNATGYSGASDSSHIAWRIQWPDPIYDTNVEAGNLITYPLSIYPIYSRFDL